MLQDRATGEGENIRCWHPENNVKMSDACAATSFSCLACTPQLGPSTGQAHHSNHMEPIHSCTMYTYY